MANFLRGDRSHNIGPLLQDSATYFIFLLTEKWIGRLEAANLKRDYVGARQESREGKPDSFSSANGCVGTEEEYMHYRQQCFHTFYLSNLFLSPK